MAEREAAEGLSSNASAEYRAGAEAARREAETTREMIMSGMEKAVEDARERVNDVAGHQQQRVAERLAGLARAIHHAAEDLENGEQRQTGRYAHAAADQMDNLAEALRRRSLTDLVDDAQSLAKNQPLLFLGGAVAAGFLISRFAKSSASAREQVRQPEDYAPLSREAAGQPYTPVAGSGIGGSDIGGEI